MYCLYCGKQIPDESKFCLHCGKPIAPQETPGFSDLPPVYLHGVGWATSGPTGKNLIGKVRRGFQVYFELHDAAHHQTRSDGQLKIKILKKNYGLINSFTPLFQTTVSVTRDQFQQSSTDPKFVGYWQNFDQTVIQEGENHFVELWFTTPDGQTLYGTDR